MAALDGPVDISTVRQNSTSPRNQTSTLSAALQGAAAQPIATPTSAPRSGNEGRLSVGGRQDSISHVGSYYGTGARPISMKDRPRRESTTAGSLLNGMSWGGVSVGSWIRDEYVSNPLSAATPSLPEDTRVAWRHLDRISCAGSHPLAGYVIRFSQATHQASSMRLIHFRSCSHLTFVE